MVMPREFCAGVEVLERAVQAADVHCEEMRLLTLASSGSCGTLRRWMTEELVGQARDGAAASAGSGGARPGGPGRRRPGDGLRRLPHPRAGLRRRPHLRPRRDRAPRRASGPAAARLPQTSWSWRHVVPGPGVRGRRVLALEQRGSSPGASPDAVDGYAGGDIVADVLGGPRRARHRRGGDLVGHAGAPRWRGRSRPAPGAGRHADRALGPAPGRLPRGARRRRRPAGPLGVHARLRPPRLRGRPAADGAAGLRSLFGADTGWTSSTCSPRVGTPPVLRRALNWYSAQSADRVRAIPPTAVPLHM